ncbi:MAG: tRNA (uridine(34)/cytosine(34)/5-carboxymethylaminomethyluridine(34)-2'-O)-methyltransferase TrmL [Clostridia bacterium]|nr:tRNA (uridine(34)/cytosine(34)/5-carboxymethylaminomethyluridine(34)-2'-O)-methyltransferase TrmL [Clostridia bacterium]MBQ7951465.1 tRNA (uridine(34)/cytosine(34)/5-carboxymethylaminomethyluridine(34)-2'-O)-methyltransferase TrmL [Clostridia bacterium]
MMTLNIVLFEPEIPQNTGNIARTCAATGAKLHLVGPMGFTIDDKKLKRAGLDYWHDVDITYYNSIREFYEKNQGVMYYLTTKAPKDYSEATFEDGCYLIFGKETAGIPEEILLENQETCLRIPMIGEIRSLNLSNSVAIVAYEAFRQDGFSHFRLEGKLTKYDWK